MSRVRANNLVNKDADGAPTLSLGAVITGPCTAGSFSGNGSGISNVISAQGLTGTPDITVGKLTVSSDATVGGALTITGNLKVDGTQTIINTETLNVADKTVGIGSTSNASDSTANGAGIEIYASSSVAGNDKKLTWGSTGTKWTLTGGGFEAIDVNCTGVTTSTGGYRGPHGEVPINSKTAAYTLLATDVGKFISITTGGVTVPASVFAVGDAVTIYNDSGSNQTITQGGSVTMYLVGTATNGNRTLAQRGLVTILCVAANTFVISGGGLT